MRGVAAEEHAATLKFCPPQRVAGGPRRARDDLDVKRRGERPLEHRWRLGIGDLLFRSPGAKLSMKE